MGAEQSNRRESRSRNDDAYFYVNSNEEARRRSQPPRPPPPRQNNVVSTQINHVVNLTSLPSSPTVAQQTGHQQPQPTTSRIYPSLPQDSAIRTYDSRENQRCVPAERAVPSAPSENLVNSNNNRTQSTANARQPRFRTPQSKDDKLNCPTCNKMYGLSIYQCASGHSCCEDCKRNGHLCRLCAQPIGDMRNFSLEDCIRDIKVPCVNAGCTLYIKKMNMDAHIKECPFNQQECPLKMLDFTKCNWKGKMNELSGHFDVVHPDNRIADVNSEIKISNFSIFLNIKHRFIHLVNMGNFHFLVHVYVDTEKVLMSVQFCGTKISANRWQYEFHVYDKQNPRRKYFYTDICQSYHMPSEEIINNAAVLPITYAKGFLNSDAFFYKFFIKKNTPISEHDGRPKNRRGRPARNSRSSSMHSNS